MTLLTSAIFKITFHLNANAATAAKKQLVSRSKLFLILSLLFTPLIDILEETLKKHRFCNKIHNMSSMYFFGTKLFFFHAANAILGLLYHVDSFPR